MSAATIDTGENFIPMLNASSPIAPKNARKKRWRIVFLSGIEKLDFAKNMCRPAVIIIINSRIKEVRKGPIVEVGILRKKYTNPHKKQVISARGIPLEKLNNWDFLKSLKSSEMSIIPATIRIIAYICQIFKDSRKKSMDSMTVNITEEFATGATTPIFPILSAL
jgi:hypothetical protein